MENNMNYAMYAGFVGYANENGIANKVSLFAKAEILVLTLPLIKSLFDMCQGLLK